MYVSAAIIPEEERLDILGQRRSQDAEREGRMRRWSGLQSNMHALRTGPAITYWLGWHLTVQWRVGGKDASVGDALRTDSTRDPMEAAFHSAIAYKTLVIPLLSNLTHISRLVNSQIPSCTFREGAIFTSLLDTVPLIWHRVALFNTLDRLDVFTRDYSTMYM